MPTIHLETKIHSTIEICFDLSTSIDLHKISTARTNEKAIAGITAGLVKLNDFVTWEAVHFGIKQQLTSKITQFNKPFHFCDEQKKGAFKNFKHDHYFETQNNFVLMKDRFEFESPFGPIGKLFNTLVLTNYLKRFLIERNAVIKEYAETDKWKEIINH